MNIEPALTKENFWGDIQKKYPLAVQEFCDWIDRYKKALGWSDLFNAHWEDVYDSQREYKSPKFHDLPYTFQLGIWLTYVKSFDKSSEYITAMIEDHDFILELGSMIDCFFSIREEEMISNDDD